MYEESRFVPEWKRFIKNLQKIARRKLMRSEGLTSNKQDLLTLFNDVTKKLLTDVHINEIMHASALEDSLVVDFYRRELKYFNDWVESRSGQSVEEDNDELDAGEKVKGSVDKIISKLPGILQKLIHILNELLKLIILAA